MALSAIIKSCLIIFFALQSWSSSNADASTTENITCTCEGGYMCHGNQHAGPCVSEDEVCDGIAQCPHGDDEFFCRVDYFNPCRGEPRVCPAHPSSCVDPPNICDGFPNCPTGEDEVACDVTSCPVDCECHYLSVRCKNVGWDHDQALMIQPDTRKLWIEKSGDQEMNQTEGLDLLSATHVNFSLLNNVNMLTIRSFPFEVIVPGTFESLRFLVYIDLMKNKISRLQANTFRGLRGLEAMFIMDNGLETIEPGAFRGLDSLLTLNLMFNDISRLGLEMFEGLSKLDNIALNTNFIEIIEPHAFVHLKKLRYLDLQSNLISSLPTGVFEGLGNLDSLHLGFNSIASIRNSTFISLSNLTYLDLYSNPLVLLDAHAFIGLNNLQTLIISETKLVNVEKDAAFGTESLQELTADDPKLCCLFEPSVMCNTPPNPFATCEGLLRTTLLRTCIWLIGISALVGNILVLAWRTYKRKLDRENSVQMSFIMNLAVADFLMGVYMVFIGSADAYFGADYYLWSDAWRNSFACKLAGFIAMVSSEASVFHLVLISLDRFICIVFPFGMFRFRTRSSRIALASAWLFAVVLAVIPIVVADRIKGFYGYSDVCIGLPLVTPATGFNKVWETTDLETEQQRFLSTGISGWGYSTAVFIVLNLICFAAIFIFYISIFIYVRKAAASSGRKTERRNEIRMAMKMAVIVGTDFLCWMPVIIMGILSQSGSAVIPVVTYVWTIVFVMPINSSLNPYLYTISTIVQKGGSRKPISSGSHRFSASSQRTSLSGGTSQTPEGTKLTTVVQ